MSSSTRSDNLMVVNYSSLEEATLAEKAFASSNGYRLVIQRTNRIGNKVGGLLKSRYLSCVHHGKPTSNAHSRKTRSARLECPFTLKISRDNAEGTSWSSRITNNTHNHESTEKITAYPILRALTEPEKNSVHSVSSVGAAPRVVHNALRQHTAENIDIDNLINHIRQRSDLLMPHQRQIYFSSIRSISDRDLEVRNPVLNTTRCRPTGTTHHNQSAFEFVEEFNLQKPLQQSNQFRLLQKIHRCRHCYNSGHNSRTCPRRISGVISSGIPDTLNSPKKLRPNESV